jgi:uncharacterized tellurite resistance protein B-like protein
MFVEPDAEWTPLHDLALVYLALMHRPDNEINPAEMATMIEKLHGWHPVTDPDLVGKVVQDVLLIYMSGASEQMVETSAASLRETLPRNQRLAVLNDLADIAFADGSIVPGEVSFIQQLALDWGIDQELG